MNDFIDILKITSAIGFPTIFAIGCMMLKSIHSQSKKMKILMNAQQAQMRSQLLHQYHIYMNSGWITEEHMQDWENQYQAYHSLGSNGIMDDRRAKLFQLPSRPSFVERESDTHEES